MTYEIIFDSLKSSYNWLFGIYFPRIFAFLKNNELVSAALIISIALPALLVVLSFFISTSSDAERFTSFAIKKYIKKSRNDEQDNKRKQEIYKLRQQGYQGRNAYHQAYLNSLKYDKKNDINK